MKTHRERLLTKLCKVLDEIYYVDLDPDNPIHPLGTTIFNKVIDLREVCKKEKK